MSWLLLLCCLQPAEPIQLVRSGQLDIRPGMDLGPVFEKYRWWMQYGWELEGDEVVFWGTYSEYEANQAFKHSQQYRLKMGFKYSRLAPTYGIDASPQAVDRIEIRFRISGSEFSVESGRFSRRPADDEPWQHTPMTNKAVLQFIKAFYHQQDPFLALVKGLPYK